MFFIGVFGVGEKEKALREFGGVVCPDCGRLTRAMLRQTFSYFHIFFIPTFRWHRRYLLKLRCCGAIYEADAAYAQELKTAESVDFLRLKKVSSGFGGFGAHDAACPSCGAAFDQSFAYCPHCGAKR